MSGAAVSRTMMAMWLGLGLSGCMLLHQSETQEMPLGPVSGGTNEGYALLYQLLGDEKDVSKLLVIKRERAELKELVKAISETSGRGYKQLERFAKSDRTINLKERGLPAMEVQTREAIAKTRAKELLTEGGKEFEVQLLLAQNEALTYGAHLAQTIARTESNADRAKYLTQLAGELAQLQRKVVAMILEKYAWRGN